MELSYSCSVQVNLAMAVALTGCRDVGLFGSRSRIAAFPCLRGSSLGELAACRPQESFIGLHIRRQRSAGRRGPDRCYAVGVDLVGAVLGDLDSVDDLVRMREGQRRLRVEAQQVSQQHPADHLVRHDQCPAGPGRADLGQGLFGA